MIENEKEKWFPAKKYGWGWGFPITWQGWLFLLLWVLVLFAGIVFLMDQMNSFAFWSFNIVMVAILITVCWVKGEKPKWRWGE